MAGQKYFVELDKEEFANFRRQVRAASAEIKKELKELHKKKAGEIAPVASVLAPYDTGRLSRSVKAGATAQGGTIRAGGASVPYAPPIHWGWPAHGIKAQRFIVWALGKISRDSKGGYEGEYLDAMMEIIQKHLNASTEKNYE